MIKIKDKSKCCGCNACAEICPKHCIHMVKDAKGFLYPEVDTGACVECGACEKTCPMEISNISLQQPLTAFAAWNKNHKEHLSSSSGGAAFVISSAILDKGGVVYGCASDGMDIRHIRVENKSELYRLQGSKYVQSDVCGLFRKVKDDLQSGKPVLFIGTPCQTAGLKNFIGRKNNNLYLVDLICHGVPSQQMLDDHVKHIAKGHEIQKISFRDGNNIIISLSAPNFCYLANVWEMPYKDLYIKGFIDGITYRPSCYKCHFACPTRVSDITIGDFWGLKYAESLSDDVKYGVSLMLPMTDKGMMLIDNVMHDMHIHERCINEAVNGNTQLRHPSIRGRRAKLFSLLYPALPFDLAMNTVVADHRTVWKLKTMVKNLLHGC